MIDISYFSRLPITDPDSGNTLYVLNPRQLLRFLLHFVPNLQYFDHLTAPIIEAGVGTFRDIEVADTVIPFVNILMIICRC